MRRKDFCRAAYLLAACLLVWRACPAAEKPPAPPDGPPAEAPPVSPFEPNPQSPPRLDARPGQLAFSDGKTLRGRVMLTRNRKIELFEDAQNQWHAFDLADLSRLDQEIEKEEKQQEWRWKEGGSDVKVFTGRFYVDREYRTTVTLADGKTRIVGHLKGTVIYLEDAKGEKQRFFLLHYDRGEMNAPPEKLIYLKGVTVEPAGGAGQKAPAAKP